jgi:hypothetical protein
MLFLDILKTGAIVKAPLDIITDRKQGLSALHQRSNKISKKILIYRLSTDS